MEIFIGSNVSEERVRLILEALWLAQHGRLVNPLPAFDLGGDMNGLILASRVCDGPKPGASSLSFN